MHAEEGQAERSGQAERRGIGVSGVSSDYGYPYRAYAEEGQATAARPSAAEKGGSGVFSDRGTTQDAHTQMEAKRSNQAERCGEGGVRGSAPTTIHHNTPTRPTSQAQWKRGIPPTAMQHNTPRSGNQSGFKSSQVNTLHAVLAGLVLNSAH
jgi:hypothetical protein